jgi:ABC-2 type transport system permease protein
VKAIIKKEIRAYFHNILLYMTGAGLMLYAGIRFSGILFSPEISTIRSVFAEVAFTLLLLIPLLTMDSFAAEKYVGTDRLLFSSAISMHNVVISKYIAAFLTFIVFAGLTLLLPMGVLLLSGVYWAEVLLLYGGVLLLGSAVCAFGIWISSMSSHGFRALMVTVAGLFAWWMLDALLPHMGAVWIRELFSFVSLFSRFDAFRAGLLSYSAVFYLISATILFLLLAIQVLRIWRQRRA